MARSGGAKRLAEKDPEDGFQKAEEAKEQRINLVEDLVDAMEDEAVQIDTVNGKIQMCSCEELVDLSYIATPEAELLEGASEVTDVGGVRSQLSDRVASCMMRSLCQSVCPFVSIGTGLCA